MLDELFRTLGALLEPPSSTSAGLTEALELGEAASVGEHTDLFQFQLFPYASVYLGGEGMLGGEARDRIAGFWRVLGATPPAEPDHLATMLAFHAELGTREAEDERRREQWRRARRAHLHEHLLSWTPVYLDRLVEIAPPVYRRWGEVLSDALEAESEDLGLPESLPVHLREAPPFEDPRSGGGAAFLASLLAPARSGVVLIRDDLLRAGRELGLAVRIGERKWVLEALFAQDAAAVLDWLKEEAAQQASRPRGRGEIARFWRERAEKTARICAESIEDALSRAPDPVQ